MGVHPLYYGLELFIAEEYLHTVEQSRMGHCEI